MVAVTDLKAWQPYVYMNKGENFQFGGIAYQVLISHTTSSTFNPKAGYYSAIFGSGGGGSGREVQSAQVNPDGDLIITYSDSTTENAGHVKGANGSDNLQIERLVVTGTNILSQTTQTMSTTKPVKLTVNHAVYCSIENPAPFTFTGTTITWNATNAGFALAPTDSVFVEYAIQS